jgi:hypothetical protein
LILFFHVDRNYVRIKPKPHQILINLKRPPVSLQNPQPMSVAFAFTVWLSRGKRWFISDSYLGLFDCAEVVAL